MDRVYKKGLSIFLMLLMVMGGISGVIVPRGGTAHAAVSFAGGTGSVSDPYQIATADQLNEVRNHLGADIYFELTADIDLSSYDNWEPIGTSDYHFYGNLDGNRFKIINLKIDRQGQYGIGLFGTSMGNITNIILEVIEVKGDSAVGSMVGANFGTISNSYTAGSVSGGSVMGGLVGANDGTISNSYAAASVSGSNDVGGLVGSNYDGAINASYATGSVTGTNQVGGLVGLKSLGTINTSYATGSVIGNSYVGGLVGYNGGTPINHSFYNSSTTRQTDTGKGTGKTTAEMQDPTTFSDWDFSKDWYILPNHYPELWAFITLRPGTNAGTTKLIGVSSEMEYKVNTGSYTPIVDTSVDNIVVGVGDKIYLRVKGAAQPALAEHIRSVDVQDITILPISSGTIAGVTAPITGATPVTAVTYSAEYTAKIEWSPVDATFAGAVAYTATVTLTPKTGYTLTGVVADFFKVDGATTTNEANSGVVTAVFPATAAIPISAGTLTGVTAPVAGVTPVTSIADTAEYKASIEWSPEDATFAGAVAYTATVTITPKAGYTLTGVPANFFTVAGATTTNAADSGIITAEFPATAAIPISAGVIAGVTVPIAGVTPTATIVDSAQYAAAITWSFVGDAYTGGKIYTAMITLTPKTGYTLTGVGAGFFTVAGATTWNYADSGVVTAVFPATSVIPISIGAIAGVTVPVTGATPVATLPGTTEYAASIAWSPADVSFAGAVAYTATITLTPKPEYTLTGVGADFFKVAGATTTNEANSGIVTAVFPATAAPITTGAIAGVTAPVAGATPVTAVTYSSEYIATVSWSPATTLFTPETAYTATIAITPKAGYTVTGVPANFFTVAGATTTNAVNSGVVTAEFPATAAIPVTEIPVTTVPITTAGIAGVTAPVTGATPVTTVTYSAEYSATVSWSPATPLFVGGTAYTATIAITPKAGYSLTGVPANFFTVAGATTTNVADSGVVTAEFPATAPDSTDIDTGTHTGSGSTFTMPTNNIVTSTNGTLTLPVNQAGEVSFEDAVKISIPAGAVAKELIVSIEKVLEPQKLFLNNELLLSPVYEITKNFAEDLSKPVTLNIAFDPTLVKSNQKAAVFYYDEVMKAWVEVAGGKIEGNHIMVEVNHFGKYAVLSVDEVTGLPVTEPVTGTSTKINLSDVAGHWAETSIQQAISMGMVKGYQDGTFQPNHTVTRAEFAVMLMSVLKTQGAGAQLTFTDTAKIGAWAQTAVAQAVQAGIITGYEDGGFRPNEEITRAEMAVILAKAQGESTEVKLTTSFADDKDIPAWAKSSVDFVKQAGMVQGKGDNKFAPQDSATRAEAVTVLLKLLAQLIN